MGVFSLSVVVALEPATSMWLLKLIVDRLATMTTSQGWNLISAFKNSFDLAHLGILLACQLALWIVIQLAEMFKYRLESKTRSNFELYIQTKIIRKCSQLDLAFFEDSDNLDKLTKVRQGASMSAWNLIWMIFNILESMITMLSLFFILFQLHWLIPLVVLLATSPQMIASAHFARKRWQFFTDESTDSRMRGYISWILTNTGSAQEVKILGLTDYLLARFKVYEQAFHEREYSFVKESTKFDFIFGSISTAATTGIWTYICLLAFGRSITTGDALMFFRATSHCKDNLLGLFSRGGGLYEQMLFLSDLFDLFDLKPESVDGALKGIHGYSRAGVRIAPLKLEHGIEFRDVSFSYPGKSELVLDKVSFFLPQDGSVAIVGKNGAGKTTLVKLLVRLYDVRAGEILIDGHDIRNYELESLRSIYSVVFQDFQRYALTLRENIGFGDIDQVNDVYQVDWAAKKVKVDEFAGKFPLGYETFLSKHYTRDGEELSVGQWQKVALARGLMRDCPIVVLDEPTASLDAFAELDTYSLFEELTANKLSILISHRFSTVRMAKLILVIDQGKIVEAGSHDELIDKAGLYAEMFWAQADRYR